MKQTYTAKLFVNGKPETQSVQAESLSDAFDKVRSAAASRFPNTIIMVLKVEIDTQTFSDFFNGIFK